MIDQQFCKYATRDFQVSFTLFMHDWIHQMLLRCKDEWKKMFVPCFISSNESNILPIFFLLRLNLYVLMTKQKKKS